MLTSFISVCIFNGQPKTNSSSPMWPRDTQRWHTPGRAGREFNLLSQGVPFCLGGLFSHPVGQEVGHSEWVADGEAVSRPLSPVIWGRRESLVAGKFTTLALQWEMSWAFQLPWDVFQSRQGAALLSGSQRFEERGVQAPLLPTSSPLVFTLRDHHHLP